MPPATSPEDGSGITVRLDDLLYERRMTLTELAERVGITLANLSILKTGKAKAIRFSTLEAICRELDCQPGDLLCCPPAAKDDETD
ncbi:helix-turn-helix domain-containing protein [Croceicoccus naphthovorans]|uniref:Cro/Cl family transcriptional regulator n=1 Tax=Croceicoccus naphthovorans TaxID=1348774 RepID=A0A0G3XHG3_9SPHN|nr:helix-turn-helix transcriptional regulator [Croceicoccus naphthovorans]AKM11010.1 Cro/Cl family transcriptional regulator [Croceicoccus naphthovorans]MBB3989571.1 putative transcriptional regulator [Croceicoccus naphthovorans]